MIGSTEHTEYVLGLYYFDDKTTSASGGPDSEANFLAPTRAVPKHFGQTHLEVAGGLRAGHVDARMDERGPVYHDRASLHERG